MRKLLSSVLILALTFSLLAPTALAKNDLPFKDIDAKHWAYQSIAWGYGEGLIKGTSHTTFSPNLPLNRGMFLTMLYRFAGSPPLEEDWTNPYKNIKKSDYFYKAVVWGKYNGFMEILEETHFDRQGKLYFTCDASILLTREEVAKLLMRYWSYYLEVNGLDTPYLDIPEFPERFTDADQVRYDNAMRWWVSEGVIKGRTPTTLAPTAHVTRAEAVTMINRARGTF